MTSKQSDRWDPLDAEPQAAFATLSGGAVSIARM
jgi:hypothetical protein